MPTYTCTAPAGCLTPERKVALAEAITTIHNAVTGAARGFAQVIFHVVDEDSFFVGGAVAPQPQLFVNGQIRAGRSALDRHRLITRLVDACSEAAGLPHNAVWVYVSELPARCMAEYGHVLPEPGDEEAWIAGLPEADRARMEG